MDIEQLREACLLLPFTTEDIPFDDTLVTFRLKSMISACISLEHPDRTVMKCDLEYSKELRLRYNTFLSLWT